MKLISMYHWHKKTHIRKSAQCMGDVIINEKLKTKPASTIDLLL